jgi:serine/threonine protein kinase
MLDQFVQEIKISLFLNHPNIVRVYGCFSDKDHVYIMMEYMEEGSLYRLAKLNKRFS